MISGRKPTTAPTPPMMPSPITVERTAGLFSMAPPTNSWNVSIQPTSQSAIQVPRYVCEIANTHHMTAAKMMIPAIGLVRTLSSLSALVVSLDATLRTSTAFTISFTKAKRFLSSASTALLSCKSISACIYGAFWLLPSSAAAAATTAFTPSSFLSVETVLMTGQFSFAESASTSIVVPSFSLMSLLFSATTTGMPSSRSCVVKNRLLLRFVASTMLMIASGCSSRTNSLVIPSSGVNGDME